MLLIEIPSPYLIVLLLWVQEMFIGKSPLWTEHVSDVKSPELTEFSPKSKDKICGGTRINEIIN